ncbi:MAG: ATP-dependent Clp protease proteolytic subunit [Alistipes finegoldii]
MKSEIQIDNNAGVCQIDIEGTIGVPEEWQFDRPEARVATYEKFRDAVRRIAEIDASEVVVNIRSTGGDVNDALLIHDALTALGAHITTRCYGYTASAATIIAQAASPGCREISANALYLIHTAVCATEGNAAEAERQTRPAAPDRRAHRRSLCRPFGTPGGRVRNPDGRKQRQRPLAVARRDRRGRSGRRRDRCGGTSRPLADAKHRPRLGTPAHPHRSQRRRASCPRTGTATSSTPKEKSGSCSAAPPPRCVRRSSGSSPRKPGPARIPPTATSCGQPTNAPTPKTRNVCATCKTGRVPQKKAPRPFEQPPKSFQP